MNELKNHKILVKDIPDLEIENWRLYFNQKDAQELKEPVEDPGFWDIEAENLLKIEAKVVNFGEHEYILNNKIDKSYSKQDDKIDKNSKSKMENGN